MAGTKAIILLLLVALFQGHKALNMTNLFHSLQDSLKLIDFLEENYQLEIHDNLKKSLAKRIVEECNEEIDLEKWLEPYSQARLAKCFAEKGRYSGTDILASRIEETRAIDVQDCQVKCQSDPECNFFLFFDKNHYQRFKHLTCRLLRSKGQLKLDQLGHVSGPKFCTDFDVQQLAVALKSSQLVGKLVRFYCQEGDHCPMLDDQLEKEVMDVIGEKDLKKMDCLTKQGDQFMERKIPHESTGNSSSNPQQQQQSDESPEISPFPTIASSDAEEFSRQENHLHIGSSTPMGPSITQWTFEILPTLRLIFLRT